MAYEMDESNALPVAGYINKWDDISSPSLNGGIGRTGPLRLTDSFHDACQLVEERGRIEVAVRLLPAIP